MSYPVFSLDNPAMKTKGLISIVLMASLLASSISCDWHRGTTTITDSTPPAPTTSAITSPTTTPVVSNPQDFEFVFVFERKYSYEEYFEVITTAEITGYTGSGGDIAIPDTINGIKVTHVREYAFKDCSNITSIMIPSSIEWIGERAFSGCTSLTEIKVDASNPFIMDIDGVLYSKNGKQIVCYPPGKTDSSYTIPSSVIWVNNTAFSGCTYLTDIRVDPANAHYIDIGGVLITKEKQWKSALLVSCPAGKTGSYTIPNTVQGIARNAFYGCTGLTGIMISFGVETIGDNAFYGCTNLVKIKVNPLNVYFKDIDGVLFTKLGKELVCYPAGKTGSSYAIPRSVTGIRDGAFSGCLNLTRVTIPIHAISIGESTFSGCTSLTEIRVDAPNPVYKDIGGVLFSEYGFMCVYPSGYSFMCIYPAGRTGPYVIPDDVGWIGRLAFKNCTGLTSITIPRYVMSIDEEDFWSCTSLAEIIVDESNDYYKDVDGVLFTKYDASLISYPASKEGSSYTIPDGVIDIHNMAFRNCTNLTSITIPSSVISIPGDAFWGCCNLTIICPSDSYAHSFCLQTGINFQLI